MVTKEITVLCRYLTSGCSLPCPTSSSTDTIHRIWCQRNAFPVTVSSHMS